MFFLILATLISWICNILIIVLLVRSVLSWVIYSGFQYNSGLGKLYRLLASITEPIVAPVRRLISRFFNTGPLDLAPLATFFILLIISRILTRLLIALV